jgi:hypothetical protein
MYSRPGKVLVRPNSDPKSAFERELDAALAAGDERVAYGLCIGLALITCETTEVLWAKAQERQVLSDLL